MTIVIRNSYKDHRDYINKETPAGAEKDETEVSCGAPLARSRGRGRVAGGSCRAVRAGPILCLLCECRAYVM